MTPPPFDERELMVLASSLMLAAATAYFRRELRRVPGWRIMLAGVLFLIVGGVSTVVEHAVAYDFFNHLEHAAYLAQSLALAFWALRLRRGAA